MKLSLIIPCYNEAKGLADLVAAIIAAELDDGFEVILVDNGSTDETPKLMAELIAPHGLIRSVRVDENQGYGFGILAGLRAALGDVLAWTHADLQTDPADIKRAAAFYQIDSDCFVKGRRYGRPLLDKFFTMGMSFFEMVLLRRFLWDINAQPTVFPRSFFEAWDDPPHDFSLDLYAYYMAKKLGLKICRFPVYFGDRKYGVSHWNVDWKSKVKFIRRTIEFSVQLKKKYM
jgi:glycosyltransferase involved in cell wall biosynthesis